MQTKSLYLPSLLAWRPSYGCPSWLDLGTEEKQGSHAGGGCGLPHAGAATVKGQSLAGGHL